MAEIVIAIHYCDRFAKFSNTKLSLCVFFSRKQRTEQFRVDYFFIEIERITNSQTMCDESESDSSKQIVYAQLIG